MTWIPSVRAKYIDLDSFGIELKVGLGWYPETVELIMPLSVVHEALERSQAEVRRRARVVIESRPALRRADLELDRDVRDFHDDLGRHDRRAGTLQGVIFPDGLKHVTGVQAWRLLERAEDVLTRAESPALKGGEAVRAQWVPIIRERVEGLRRALQAREEAYAAFRAARRQDEVHRRAFVTEVDRIAGQLRVIFPGDPATRNAIWPRRPRRRPEETVEEMDDLLDDMEPADELSDMGEITEVLPPPPVTPLEPPAPPRNGHPR